MKKTKVSDKIAEIHDLLNSNPNLFPDTLVPRQQVVIQSIRCNYYANIMYFRNNALHCLCGTSCSSKTALDALNDLNAQLKKKIAESPKPLKEIVQNGHTYRLVDDK